MDPEFVHRVQSWPGVSGEVTGERAPMCVLTDQCSAVAPARRFEDAGEDALDVE